MSRAITDNTCLVCLNEQEIMINLLDEVDDFQARLSDLLEQCGDFKIEFSDNYPKLICNECTSELLVAAKFRAKCKHTQEVLSQFTTSTLFGDEHQSEVDPDEIKKEIEDEDDGVIMDSQEQEDDNESRKGNEAVSSEMFDDMRFDDDTDSNGQIYLFESDGVDGEIVTEKISAQNDDRNLYQRVIKAAGTSVSKKVTPPQATKPLVINYKCDFCGAGFAQVNNLKRHIRTHTPEELFTCAICACPFTKFETFKDHIHDHEKESEKEPIIEDEIITEIPSKGNIILMHADGDEAIIVCDRDPDRKEPKEPKKLPCPKCHKSFVSKSALETHIRIHTGERPFKCVVCNKSFTTAGGLVLHTKRHTGYKPFCCNVCDKSFVESSNLKVHMRIHTGEKPHKCTICQRSFARVFLLQIHQRTHTGERPYQCPYCDKAFAQQGDLASHKRIHTGERPHTCPYCKKGFIKSSALTQHLRKHMYNKVLPPINNNNNNNTSNSSSSNASTESSTSALKTKSSSVENFDILIVEEDENMMDGNNDDGDEEEMTVIIESPSEMT